MRISFLPLIRIRSWRAVLGMLSYMVLAGALIWYTEHVRIAEEREHASSLVGEQAMAVQLNIEQALSSTYSLATMVMLGKGELAGFELVAAAMRSIYPSIAALQLAPGGVISRIEPMAGNERALGHNLMADPERDKEALLAKNTGKLTLAGPFPLLQGGLGAAGRLPVYLKDSKGKEQFWGFVIVLIRFPDALVAARLSRLEDSGYRYQLWRVHPDNGGKHIIAATVAGPLSNPVERTLEVPNATWTLSAVPINGWINRTSIAIKTALALVILMLLVTGWRRPR